jgi:aminocarboxymuconate-semialdehyde decarboxylase
MEDTIIDFHAHVYPEGCFADIVSQRTDFELIRHPDGRTALFCRGTHVMSIPKGHDDLKKRLEIMDRAGVGVEVLSVGAVNIGWAGSRASAAARLINDGLAAVCREYSGRFRFVAALPCESPTEMIGELDRALTLGAAGVGVPTTVGDKSLDAPELTEFWREMSRRRLMVLVHPTFPPNGPANDPGQFLAVGYPAETTMAATRLALSGVLEECPEARVVWSHCGGGLGMMMDRIDRGYQRYSTCPQPPSHYLRRCFFDTACAHGPALDCARATFGIDTLVYGSDEPHVPNATAEVVAALRARPWPGSDLSAVLSGNAKRLLDGI